jgi:GAF domain-containing protein
MDQHWTLCVYKAEADPNTKRVLLCCIGGLRSVPCDLKAARKWPEGVGTCGVAYATGMEVVEPDIWDKARAQPAINPDLTRPHDTSRYRSIAAVPISLNSRQRPWGVAVATSDRVGHFSNGLRTGAKTVEAVRSLAVMVGLAVEVCHNARLVDQRVDSA